MSGPKDQNKFYFVDIISPLDMLKKTINGFQDVESAVNLVDTCNTKISVITQPISKTGGSNRTQPMQICRISLASYLIVGPSQRPRKALQHNGFLLLASRLWFYIMLGQFKILIDFYFTKLSPQSEKKVKYKQFTVLR